MQASQTDSLGGVQYTLTRNLHLPENVHKFPALPDKSHQAPPKKWLTSLDTAGTIDFQNVVPVSDIYDIQWKSISRVQRSDAGSEGLFFVEANNNNIFIIKRSSSLVAEVFGTLLALRMNLYTPKVRVILGSSEEGIELFECMHQVDKNNFRVVTTLANQTHLLAMEFIRGQTLRDIKQNTAGIFGDPVLIQLGEIMALDTITNNSDRLPLVWQNGGNVGNIMICENGPTAVPIDNKVVPLHEGLHGNTFIAYVRKVKELVATVFSTRAEITQFSSIRNLISAHTGYDMGIQGTLALQEGFKRAIYYYTTIDIDALSAELNTWGAILTNTYNLNVNPHLVPFVITMLQAVRDGLSNPVPRSLVDNSTEPVQHNEEVQLNATDECAWKRITVDADKPSPRRYHSSIFHNNGLYVFGGVGLSKVTTNDVHMFDFESCKWTLLKAEGTAPSPRCAHTAVVYRSKMWVFGGYNYQYTAYNDMFTLDLDALKWQQITVTGTAPAPRYFHSATVIGDNLYVVGGCFGKSKHSAEMFKFSFEQCCWEQLSSRLPDAKGGHIAFECNNNLYVYGGFSGDGGFDHHFALHRFDMATNVWQECDISGTFPRTARALSSISCKVTNARGELDWHIYVFGGFDGKVPLNMLLCLSLTDLTWKPIKLWLELPDITAVSLSANQNLLPIPRYGHSSIFDKAKSTITIFGGCGSTLLNDLFQIVLCDS